MSESVMSTGCTAFAGSRRIATGELPHVAAKVKETLLRDAAAQVLIFDNVSSEQVEIDLRGTVQDVVKRLTKAAAPDVPTEAESPAVLRGPGRPKLGVVAREVTLLPRHWEWLNSRPGGASVALRKLVEEARRATEGQDRIRLAQEATNRFMTAMAGNRPNFEEATRALFAGQQPRFEELTQAWPADIRNHTRQLAAPVFEGSGKVTV